MHRKLGVKICTFPPHPLRCMAYSIVSNNIWVPSKLTSNNIQSWGENLHFPPHSLISMAYSNKVSNNIKWTDYQLNWLVKSPQSSDYLLNLYSNFGIVKKRNVTNQSKQYKKKNNNSRWERKLFNSFVITIGERYFQIGGF